MAFLARKPFVFSGHAYKVGDVVRKLDKYQEETFVRAGFVSVAPDAPRKPKMTEVVPEEAERELVI